MHADMLAGEFADLFDDNVREGTLYRWKMTIHRDQTWTASAELFTPDTIGLHTLSDGIHTIYFLPAAASMEQFMAVGVGRIVRNDQGIYQVTGQGKITVKARETHPSRQGTLRSADDVQR